MDRGFREDRDSSLKSRYRDDNLNRDEPYSRGGYRGRLPHSSSYGGRGSTAASPPSSGPLYHHPSSSLSGGQNRMSRGGGSSRMSSGYRPMPSRGSNNNPNYSRSSSDNRGPSSRDSYYDSRDPVRNNSSDYYQSALQQHSFPEPSFVIREPEDSKYPSYRSRDDLPSSYTRNGQSSYMSSASGRSTADVPIRSSNDPYYRDYVSSSVSLGGSRNGPYTSSSRDTYRNSEFERPDRYDARK